MCTFCDDLKHRHYRIPVRTSLADDNRCEFGSPDITSDGFIFGCKCEDCYGCSDKNLYFEISTYENRVSFSFYHKIKNLIITPISETITINFCPLCGKRLSDELIDDDKICCGKGLEMRKTNYS